MFGKKKQRKVQKLILQHAALVGDAVERYERMVAEYLDGNREFKEESRHIDEVESEADKVRFEVEHKLFKGGFLATQREDAITVLEAFDRVANKAEACGDFLSLVRPVVPDIAHEPLRKIASLTVDAYKRLVPLLDRIADGDYDIRDEIKTVGRAESKIDRLQFQVVREVYKLDELDKLEKYLFLEATNRVTSVSDRVENAGDALSLIAIRRKMA